MLGFDRSPEFVHADPRHWVHVSKDIASLFLTTLWCLWVRRNKAVIDRVIVADSEVLHWINQEDCKSVLTTSPSHCPSPIFVSWKRPE